MRKVVEAKTHKYEQSNLIYTKCVSVLLDPSRVLSHMMSRNLLYSMNMPHVTPSDSQYKSNVAILSFILFIFVLDNENIVI